MIFLLCYGHLWTDNACDSMMRFYYIFSMVIGPVNQTITCMMNLLPIYCLSLISGSTPGSYKNCLLLCKNLLCALIVYTLLLLQVKIVHSRQHMILLTSTWRIHTQTDRLTVLLTVQTKEHTGDIPFTVSKQTAGLNTLTAHSRRQYKHTTGKTLRLFN